MMAIWDGSGISWTICKQSAPCSRQITTSTPNLSVFTGWMLFLTPNQRCQSTEGESQQLQLLENIIDQSTSRYLRSTIGLANTVSLSFHQLGARLAAWRSG